MLWKYIQERSDMDVERGSISEKLEVKRGEKYPVHVTVNSPLSNGYGPEHHVGEQNNAIGIDGDANTNGVSHETGPQEIIKATYLLACDGAHSWTRRQLGIPMLGDDIDIIWGVMDLHLTTDFPDARMVNMFISNDEHSGMLWIPRERGIIRIYCVVAESKVDEDGKFVRSSVSEESIFASIKKSMKQFEIQYSECEWWAAYQIGQRVARDNIDPTGRVFLVGDAVHTHSPKAGQGMNVSMADAFNLVWKLNYVIKGYADPKILETYRHERLPVAQRLVNFDRSLAAAASGRPPPPVPEGTLRVDDYLSSAPGTSFIFMRGLDVVLPPSVLVHARADTETMAKTYFAEGELPGGIVTGMRMPSRSVAAHSDTGYMNVGDLLRCDGCKFRLIVFAGDLSDKVAVDRLWRLSGKIERQSSLRPFLEVIVIHSADRFAISNWIRDLPEICHPKNERGGTDYYKLFYEHETITYGSTAMKPAYEAYEVDRQRGSSVLIRPDGFVAYQGEVEDFEGVQGYFANFLLAKQYLEMQEMDALALIIEQCDIAYLASHPPSF